MKLVTAEERKELFRTFKREAVHLELRDDYATNELERTKAAEYKAGERDESHLEFMEPWCQRVREGIAQGKSYRRACVVSEPLSDYQQWAHYVSTPQVEAGEDLRWVPRRLVSAVALPGNDFWMFDEEVVVFGIFSGSNEVVERQFCTDPDVARLCKDAFDAVWALSIPHLEYKPS